MSHGSIDSSLCAQSSNHHPALRKRWWPMQCQAACPQGAQHSVHARGDHSSMAMQPKRLQHLTCFPATPLAMYQRSIAAEMIKVYYRHLCINPCVQHTSPTPVTSGANVLSQHLRYYCIIRETAATPKLPLATRVQHEVGAST